jgi:hypothetical protein
VYTLQETRRYKVICVDNHYNSHPKALPCVAQLAKENLPENPTDAEKDSADLDIHVCDLAYPDQIRKVFETYGKGGIWAVVHVAVSDF